MSSIPLPALHIQPPSDPTENFSKLAMLANQLQNAPIQRQVLQGQAQAQNLENQQKTQALKDQQAVTAAMQEWDGKDFNSLPSLILKHGGSGQTVIGMKNGLIKQQQDLANLSKDQLSVQAQTNDQLLGHIDAIKGVQDPQQRAQVAQSQAQQILQAGLHKNMDPQSAQMIMAVANGQMVPNDDQLSLFEKGLTAHSVQIEQAFKQAETGKNAAQTEKLKAELEFYKKKGLAPGVPLDVQEAQDWLSKNPGKGPADFMAYKAKLVPQFNFNLQAGGVNNAATPTNAGGGGH